jgi:hypothetical protein
VPTVRFPPIDPKSRNRRFPLSRIFFNFFQFLSKSDRAVQPNSSFFQFFLNFVISDPVLKGENRQNRKKAVQIAIQIHGIRLGVLRAPIWPNIWDGSPSNPIAEIGPFRWDGVLQSGRMTRSLQGNWMQKELKLWKLPTWVKRFK